MGLRERIGTVPIQFLDTDMDMGRIAALSGYTSASYFMQAFKSGKKTSPGAWRRSLRK